MSDRLPIRALIADDEPLGRRGIRQLLARHEEVVIVGEAKNGKEAVRAIALHRPDLVFLDVQMPEGDGFDVAHQVSADSPPVIIFVTAYDEFAVRAFEAHALDYLVKPVTAERFDAALVRARRQLRQQEAAELSSRLAALLRDTSGPGEAVRDPVPHHGRQRPGAPARMLIPVSSGERVVDIADIDWIEADDYYAAVHAHGKRFLVRDSLTSLERRLASENFVRVHRGALVNVERVREVRTSRTTDEARLILSNGMSIPVSRRRRAELEARLRARTR